MSISYYDPIRGQLNLVERTRKFDPYHDKNGQFASASGGSGGTTGSVYSEADFIKYTELKKQHAQINNELLKYVDNPTAPEVQAKMDQMCELVKQMSTLHADPGGLEGIGRPGGPKDLVVVGGGPGGLTSSIMAGADGLDTMLIEAQPDIGGQAKYSSRIENYPGFPLGVTGSRLAASMKEQTARLGTQIRTNTRVIGITQDPKTGMKTLTLDNGEKIESRAVMLAGGVEFRKVQFPGADSKDVIYGNGQEITNNYSGKPVVILGGSNGAAQAALGAAQTASKVYLLSRSPLDKSMSDYQVTAVKNHPKIQVIENDQIHQAFLDDQGRVTGVVTEKGVKMDANAIGVFLGSAPKTDWLPSSIDRQNGKVVVNSDLETTMSGVFAIGDTRVGSIGRVGAAVGDGQMAEHSVFSYFAKLKDQGDAAKKQPVAKAEKLKVTQDRTEIQKTMDELFDLDRANPQPLSESVEE